MATGGDSRGTVPPRPSPAARLAVESEKPLGLSGATLSDRFHTLTGKWLGRYGYAHSTLVVPFEADIVDSSGDLSGQTSEPNTFRFDLGSSLDAVLFGGRSDGAVNFIKRYNGFSHDDDPVYAGLVNTSLTRIEGNWRFPRKPWATGPFTMMRKPSAAARASGRNSAERPETVR